jgi:hypothetical protein
LKLTQAMALNLRTLRLTCSEFYIDARLTAVEGRWLGLCGHTRWPEHGNR